MARAIGKNLEYSVATLVAPVEQAVNREMLAPSFWMAIQSINPMGTSPIGRCSLLFFTRSTPDGSLENTQILQ